MLIGTKPLARLRPRLHRRRYNAELCIGHRLLHLAGLKRNEQPDYATLLDAVARRVRSGSSLTSAVVDEINRDTPLGVMRVDNMARQRITRVSLQLKPSLLNKDDSGDDH